MSALNWVTKNSLKIFTLLLPPAIVAGIIDYRFHNYFWPSLNALRPRTGFMFDFFSVLTLFVIILSIIYLIHLTSKLKEKLTLSLIHIPVFLIFGGCIVAAVNFAPYVPQIKSAYWQIFINFISPIIVFWILFSSLKEPVWQKRFTKSFLLTISLLGALCIFEFFTNILPGTNRDFLGREVWPYVDPFIKMKAESANWLAYIFGPAVILAAINLIENIKNSAKIKEIWLEIIALIICGIALLLTKSYTGISITGFILFLWLFRNLHGKYRLYLVAGLIVLLAAGIGSQYNTKKFQILLGNYKKENSIQRREQIYTFNAKSFIEKPVVGIGPGNYQSYFRANMNKYGINIPEEEIPPHPHNLITFFWSEIGLFGLLAILFIYGFVVYKIIFHPNVFYFVMLYPLGHGIIDVPYGLEEFSMLFWVFLGLSVLLDKKELAKRG